MCPAFIGFQLATTLRQPNHRRRIQATLPAKSSQIFYGCWSAARVEEPFPSPRSETAGRKGVRRNVEANAAINAAGPLQPRLFSGKKARRSNELHNFELKVRLAVPVPRALQVFVCVRSATQRGPMGAPPFVEIHGAAHIEPAGCPADDEVDTRCAWDGVSVLFRWPSATTVR